ncbi:hypothetical protein MRB53_019550 [Persea americana]|uniref:Uncharacterized protein n=1 Tax=Persea americana TaxID=3435 RepID=A0ACC2KZ22_PERAE|nr:hypothetical protein MRB53_019550 [Persea americana]
MNKEACVLRAREQKDRGTCANTAGLLQSGRVVVFFHRSKCIHSHLLNFRKERGRPGGEISAIPHGGFRRTNGLDLVAFMWMGSYTSVCKYHPPITIAREPKNSI